MDYLQTRYDALKEEKSEEWELSRSRMGSKGNFNDDEMSLAANKDLNNE